MSRLVVTPWRYATDLLAVRDQLYGSNQDEKKLAVDRVMAWRLRGNLPHAVESTALLVDAFNHHATPGNSSFSIRAVYSAAFCRFVTGFCDIGRNKERSLESSSMLEIAKQIDMPLDFVALRHEATHEELPGEGRIVLACQEALQWLWKVYWSKLAEVQHDLNNESGLQDLTRQLFREHRKAMKGHLTSRMSPQDRRKDADERVKNVLAIGSVQAEVVVDAQLLMPNDRAAGGSMEGALLLWNDLLLALHNEAPQAFLDILDQLVLSLGSANESVADATHLWLLHLSHERPQLQTRILRHCVLYSSPRTRKLGEELLAEADADLQEEYSDLLSAAAGSEQISAAEGISAGRTEPNSNGQTRSWYRMVLPPGTPIGIVA